MKKCLALLLVVSLARAQEQPAPPVLLGPAAAPDTYAKVIWKYGDKEVAGYWFSPQQVTKTSARIDYLEKQAAKQCVDETVTQVTPSGKGWLWTIGGIIVGGGLGYLAAKKL